ncbi:MAG TPA: 3-methyl-2-oxobutanoate hydroxymethyltransferase [Polyangia bacterium]
MTAPTGSPPSPSPGASAKLTALALGARKGGAEKVAVVTAYDVAFARLADRAGADVILVGDSLGMVVQGHASTLPVTLDEMVYHCRAVARGVTRAHVVADMPFMSYQASVDEGMRAAGRLMKEGGAEAVKLEGGVAVAELIRRLVSVGIPVMGHVGMTPQSVHAFGGFKVQGRTEVQRQRILADARAVAEAGAYAMVIEAVPRGLGQEITAEVPALTIGIGAGPACDGQVLVMHDVLGLDPTWKPRFARRYADLGQATMDAFGAYFGDVRAGRFPSEGESFE